MNEIVWGIVGPGAIARNFTLALNEAPTARLGAVSGRNLSNLVAFGQLAGLPTENLFTNYTELLASPKIDAVYIATPHPSHAQLSIDALRAGKHVLCEKPAGINSAQVATVTEVARQCGRFWAEGLMYRHHPQIKRLRELLQEGVIGDVLHIEASFGFKAKNDPASRLIDPALGGGAIFDVGVYPLSFARLVAGTGPVDLCATGTIGDSGADLEAHALLRFANGITANCATSIRRALANDATITGTNGAIHLNNPWTPGRDAGPSDTKIVIENGSRKWTEKLVASEMLFTFEAEAASQAIARGRSELADCSWQDSIDVALAVERWRAGLPRVLRGPKTNKLSQVLPPGLPEIQKLRLEGLNQPLSPLIMGCDNQDRAENAAILWDAWWEAGGNAFDTAWVYGGGRHEAVLGEWLRSRGLGKEAVVIAKGAHSPLCLPDVIEVQLNQSLDRLGLDSVPVYIMHRDNPAVPVDEFADALNRLKQAGRIGIFGGSNWHPERFAAACDYAKSKGCEPPRILNNNLSLAVMERPVWPGCLSSNQARTLSYLTSSQTVHLAWSSQARGYFLPAELRNRLPRDTSPDHCFGSAANQERRRRAEVLADERGVEPHQIATAWVLSQPFPSLALIGPRSTGELATSLPALSLQLTPAEIAWLNLAQEQRA